MGSNCNLSTPCNLLPIVALCAGLLIPSVSYGLSVKETNLKQDAWLSTRDSIKITIDKQVGHSEGELRFLLNKSDLTALFNQRQPRVFEYDSSVFPLPTGTAELTVYLVDLQGQWQEIGRFPVQVKTPVGFKESLVKGTVNLNIKSELDNNYAGDAVAPTRQKETDLTTQISMNSSSSNDDFQIQTNFNLLGVSRREEALRFGEKGDEAEKLDLSDYLLQVGNERHAFSLGHISYGSNRYLVDAMGSRGLTYRGQFGDKKAFDFSVASMNGTSIVGYNNFTGLSNNDHHVSAAILGYEFIDERPGGLRAELMYMDASIQSLNNFDAGEIPDAEASQGLGLRLTGATETDRLRGELTWAQSNYFNPQDPSLAQGTDIVEVTERKDAARYAELFYEPYRSEPDKQGRVYSIGATISHEHVDPLYKSLGAFASADTQTNQATLAFQLGLVNLQLSTMQREDNVDDISTILKTKTDTDSASLSVPLKSLLSDAEKPNNWLPDFQFQYNQTHQYGANLPPTFDPDSHVPDQLNTSLTYSLVWSMQSFSVKYDYSESEQDNRQPGRAAADFRNKRNGLNLNYNITETFDMTVGVTKVEAFDNENNLTTFDDNYTLGFNWRMTDKLGLSANYSEADGSDSQLNTERTGVTGQAQLNWQFEMPGISGRKTPGQFFISYAMQDNRNIDNVFNVQNDAKSWTINTGLNISLF